MSKEKYISPLVLSVKTVAHHGFLTEQSAEVSTDDVTEGVNDDDLSVKEYSGFDGDDFSVGPWE